MTHRPIIDAGPGLNFFSANRERLLIAVLGPLSTPETVHEEMSRKAARDPRFAPARTVLDTLGPRWLETLSDDTTPELNAVVRRITSQALPERRRAPKDLGELMVIAHAVVAAEAGQDVTVLIDDGAGTRSAVGEIERLGRLKAGGSPVGTLRLAGTVTVLRKAVRIAQIPDRRGLRELYQRLRELDDDLVPIENTGLLSPELWRPD